VSVTETLLVFVLIPVAAVLLIAGLAAAGGGRGPKRYRPGRSYEFTPVWFLAAPEQVAPAAGTGARALTAGDHAEPPATRSGAPALTAGPGGAGRSVETTEAGAAAPAGSTGGASDRW
jgi:hypothetical protein